MDLDKLKEKIEDTICDHLSSNNDCPIENQHTQISCDLCLQSVINELFNKKED